MHKWRKRIMKCRRNIKKRKKKKTAREDTASKIKWEIRVKRKISGSIINTIRFSIQLSVGVIKVTVLAQPSFGISTVSPTNDNMIIACCKYYMCISFPLASVSFLWCMCANLFLNKFFKHFVILRCSPIKCSNTIVQ